MDRYESGRSQNNVSLQDDGQNGHSKQALECKPELDEIDRQAQRSGLTKTKSLGQRISLLHEILIVGFIYLAMSTTQVGLGICIDLLHVIGDDFGITNPGILS
jgi:hypothetical protein